MRAHRNACVPPRRVHASRKSVYKQGVDAQVAVCANHAEREAIGICVRCRTRVCSECATKIEGINYCVSCLSGLAVEGGRSLQTQARASARYAHLSASAYFVTLWALVWVFLEVVMPGGR